MNILEERFHKAMIQLYEDGKRYCNYPAHRFLEMVIEHEGVATAKFLLGTHEPSSGFTELWKCGRLDLTVEAHVLRPEFSSLFTQEELAEAKKRLDDLGYEFE